MKNLIRKEVLEKRKNLNYSGLSIKIIKNLINTKEYKQSKNIICYYPLKYEVDTSYCINDNDKNIFLPRVNGNFLDICDCSNLKKGCFGIYEPQTEAIKDYSKIDMIIIPCLAADRKGYRIGYGKGYYDRFLPTLPLNCKKVILVYSDFLYDNIFPENHDIQSDMIISEKEIIL